MRKVILEGRKFTSREKMHSILMAELRFPEYYGKNLDALWDCLTGEIELPLIVEWKNYEDSKQFLGEYAEKTLEMFLNASKLFGVEFQIIVC